MKARVRFTEMIQDSQDYGSDDEHMVSRVFFDLDVDGDHHPNLHVHVKQTVGSDFETAPLEVGPPEGYRGPFNYEAFRRAVESYYRAAVGRSGTGIRIEGATNVRMRDNRFVREQVVEFEVSRDAGW